MEAYLFDRKKTGEDPVKLVPSWGSEETAGASGQNLFAWVDSKLTRKKLSNLIEDVSQAGERQVALVSGAEGSIWELTRQGWQNIARQKEDQAGFQAVAVGNGLWALASGSLLYLYRWQRSKVELVALRETCGVIRKMLFWFGAENNLVVLSQSANGFCLELFQLTDKGLKTLDVLTEVPGEVLGQVKKYLLVGGSDGRVYIYEWQKGRTQRVLTTEILGTRVTALTAWEQNWAAATPGGYVFIFTGLDSQPASLIYFKRPVSDLSWLSREKIAVGLNDGWLELAYWYPPTDFYTVREADTLWSIAQALGLELKDLITRNGLEENDLLKPGQILKIRN